MEPKYFITDRNLRRLAKDLGTSISDAKKYGQLFTEHDVWLWEIRDRINKRFKDDKRWSYFRFS